MYKCQSRSYSTNQPYNLRKHEKAMHKERELKEKLENNLESYLEEFNRKNEIRINIDLNEIIWRPWL